MVRVLAITIEQVVLVCSRSALSNIDVGEVHRAAQVDLSAPTNNATYPALSGVLIDDQATGAVTVNGGGTVKLGGAMYFPNADVSWGGTAESDFTTCSMVVANTLTINGNAYLSADRGCGSGLLPSCQDPSRRFGAMMRKLDQRGVAALEFCIIAVPLFTLMFAIFDLGRYAITRQSLHALANVGARKMMINCYTNAGNS